MNTSRGIDMVPAITRYLIATPIGLVDSAACFGRETDPESRSSGWVGLAVIGLSSGRASIMLAARGDEDSAKITRLNKKPRKIMYGMRKFRKIVRVFNKSKGLLWTTSTASTSA